MKIALRADRSLILVVVCLVLLSGCAQKAKTVAFTPPIDRHASEELEENKLNNLPLETLVARGEVYMAQGKLPLARLHYLKALDLAPESADIHTRLGRLFLKAGQTDQAGSAFANALELEPDSIRALVGAGKASRLRGKGQEAEEFFHRALLIRPEDPEVLTELAICYDANGKQAQAEMLYRRVTELLPDNSSAFNNLGFNYLLQEKYPEGVGAFQEALMRAPRDQRVQNNLAAACILSGNEGQGLALFENTVGQAGAYNNVGYIYLVQKKWTKAEKAFAKALELSPDYYVKAGRNLDHLKALHAGQSENATGQSGYRDLN
jgi:Flp pilus assembly protein TadD